MHSDTDAQTVSDRLVLARRNSGGSQSEKLHRKKFIRSSIPSSSDDSVSVTSMGREGGGGHHNFITRLPDDFNLRKYSEKFDKSSNFEKCVSYQKEIASRKGSSGYANSTNSENMTKISEKSSCEYQKSCISQKSCHFARNSHKPSCQHLKVGSNRVRRSSVSGSSNFSNTYNRLSDDGSCDCTSLGHAKNQNCEKSEFTKNETSGSKMEESVGDQLKAQLDMLRAEKMAWMLEKEQLLAKLRRVNISGFNSDDVEMV